MRTLYPTQAKRLRSYFFGILSAFTIFSCSKKAEAPVDASGIPTPPAAQPPATTQVERIETVQFQNPTAQGNLKAVLFIPQTNKPVPAVVVMHGSSGLWSSTDTDQSNMALQFKSWIDSFRKHEIAALFVDSYSPRGVKILHNSTPPENLFLAAEFIRPRDAYAGLAYLRTLSTIQPDRIALLGFSHGGTTVLSTIVDAQAVAKTTPWSLISNGVEYTEGVLPPAEKPSAGGFVAAVSFYPGAAMFSYYGRPGTPSNGKYIPYAPLMIHAAANDPLYTAQYTNSDNNTQISAYEGLLLKAQKSSLSAAVKMHVYPGAAHTFDGVTGTGADADASQLARSRTLAFLKQYLF